MKLVIAFLAMFAAGIMNLHFLNPPMVEVRYIGEPEPSYTIR